MTPPPKRHRARRIAAGIVAAFAVIVVAVILLWNWDWFIPFVQSRASAALGRKVTIAHLHVALGRDTNVAADDVTIANPDGFPAEAAPFAKIGRLAIVASLLDYWHGKGIVLPNITLDRPDVHATALANGHNNFTIALAPSAPGTKPTPPPQIGSLVINDGSARLVDPARKSDFTLSIATRAADGKEPSALVVDAKGTYAAQPITGRFVGGALLTLRDASHPYPVDLHVANGPTKVSMVGTVENPLNFAGARIKLTFSGPDMALLFPLTGIPIPQTPPFSIAGNVDYSKTRIRFTDFAGRVGSSDLEGDITVDPHAGTGGKPDVIMDLTSRRVDLTDLGGFIGTTPGKKTTPGETVAQKQTLAKTEAKKTLFPDTPINLPKIRAADIHLKYRGEHIEKYLHALRQARRRHGCGGRQDHPASARFRRRQRQYHQSDRTGTECHRSDPCGLRHQVSAHRTGARHAGHPRLQG